MVAERVKGLKYAIRDVVLPAKKLEAKGHEIIKLNIGDPDQYDFDTPQHIKQAACDAIMGGKNYYGDSQGDAPILGSIRAWDKRVNGSEADDYCITQGASEGVEFSFSALVEPGAEALVPGPNYPQYMSVPRLCDGVPVEYACAEGDGWQPDVDDVRKKISGKTRVMVVINPNNPTGAVYSKKMLQSLIDVAGEHSLPLVSDEIYNLMTFQESVSLSSLVKDTPVITLNGISKNYLSPGWRIGSMAFRNCPEIFEACLALGRNRLCVNEPCAWGFKAALDGPQAHIEETKKKLIERRDFVVKRFGEMGVHCVEPKAAFYAFPRIDTGDDKQWVLDLLHQEHVLVVHGSGFGEYGKGHFRLVFLPPIEVLSEALDRIERFVKNK
ncbi:MAG: aminotransferase class I/II-fold pyridoxal phosphate-dependent enzyme [Candidatus Diapherotrites archaeon]|nr:aminotransferase class I/II-fold pyridoxal phosphate-dependent enzyme [Candidatus Diapherotrites archaeon]